MRRRRVAAGVEIGGVGVGAGMIGTECDVHGIRWEDVVGEYLPMRWS